MPAFLAGAETASVAREFALRALAETEELGDKGFGEGFCGIFHLRALRTRLERLTVSALCSARAQN
jgi:hypothetical protein